MKESVFNSYHTAICSSGTSWAREGALCLITLNGFLLHQLVWSSPGRDREDKNGPLFIFYPFFLGKALALFHKVRNSYYTIIAAESPEASVYNDNGNFTSPDRNVWHVGAAHLSWSGADRCIQNLCSIFVCLFILKEKVKKYSTFNELFKSWIFRSFNCAIVLLCKKHCTAF